MNMLFIYTTIAHMTGVTLDSPTGRVESHDVSVLTFDAGGSCFLAETTWARKGEPYKGFVFAPEGGRFTADEIMCDPTAGSERGRTDNSCLLRVSLGEVAFVPAASGGGDYPVSEFFRLRGSVVLDVSTSVETGVWHDSGKLACVSEGCKCSWTPAG
jgi:hypothetical protein